MSIPLVIQVYEEIRRLAIAGSAVASGDFRLKKLVEPLKKSAEKAPVFGKIAEAADRLLTASEKESASALLELGVLVNAVLYTQGETGIEGELKPVATKDLGIQTTQASARVLKPLLEALGTTGPGRLEIIRAAHEHGQFRDLRLVNPALKALDDVYGEIADFVAEEVLPLYGTAIVPELRATFKTPGKSGDARRLRLLYRLDPRGSRDLVELALEEGAKEVGVAAIECLGDSPDDLPHLLEKANAKAKEVRAAALQGLARRVMDDAIIAVFQKSLAGKDLDIAVQPACACRHPELLRHLVSDAQSQLAELLKLKDKAKVPAALERFNSFLNVFEGRDDAGTESTLLACFEKRDALRTLKGTNVSGQDVSDTVARLMAMSRLPNCHAALASNVESLAPEQLAFAFIGMSRVGTPAEVFATFSPLLQAEPSGQKKSSPAARKRQVLEEFLQNLLDDDDANQAYGQERLFRRGFGRYYRTSPAHEAGAAWTRKSALDPRWLDAAVAAENVTLVCSLARSNHEGCAAFLSRALKSSLAKKDASHDVVQILSTMLKIGHSESTDGLIEAITSATAKKSAYYHTFWLARLIPELPVAAVAKVEALLPSLPEKVLDEFAPYVQTLKDRAQTMA